MNPGTEKLMADMKEWYYQHPFRNGINWEFEYYWARMTDEQAFAFLLKHPEHSHRFKKEE